MSLELSASKGGEALPLKANGCCDEVHQEFEIIRDVTRCR